MLYERKGLAEQALREYEKFIETCDDARPPMPEVQDARRRASRLRK
jgi:hypothetical protein